MSFYKYILELEYSYKISPYNADKVYLSSIKDETANDIDFFVTHVDESALQIFTLSRAKQIRDKILKKNTILVY